MGLLDKLTKDGSLLTAMDGKKPLEYDKESNYYPDLLDDYELYLQKKEGNIYTLPSCGLTTTE